MSQVLVIGYLMLLGLLSCYGVYRYCLLWLYYRVKSRRPIPPASLESWPTVTIQIPVYNERYVVERAIRSACEVDYPQDRLEIQLLDDSTDDTSAVIARTLTAYRRQGLKVLHLRRENRAGFKAGALAEGLKHATSELIAVFDVDFIIPRDFLTRTAPFFADPKVGMVQARWGHVNANYSLLTQAQAVFLDGHFAIEQVARHRAGRFFNFNGTAGIWRRDAITSSGGWQPDTLTEDLDLSYRAQLAGWRGVFLWDLMASAELPVEMNAFKTQQYRWTKGSIQTAKKLLLRLLTSCLPWRIKAEAFFHLTSFFIYPLGLLASLGMLPLFTVAFQVPHRWYVDLVWLLLLVLPGACFYLSAQRELYPNWQTRLALIAWVVAVGAGLLVNNTRAVLDGLLGRDLVFIRTTKFGIQAKADRWRHKRYRAPRTHLAWVELGLAGYFVLCCLVAFERRLVLALPTAALFALGFAYVGGLSVLQAGLTRRRVRLQTAGLESRWIQRWVRSARSLSRQSL